MKISFNKACAAESVKLDAQSRGIVKDKSIVTLPIMAIQTYANPSDWAGREDPTTICLFDVDGTLSLSRKVTNAHGPLVLIIIIDG